MKKKSAMVKPVLIVFALFIYLLSSCDSTGTQKSSTDKKDMVLWYQTPGEKWFDGLPLGNGYMGAMVFGRVQNERIALNESSFWSGRPNDYDNPEALKYYPRIKELMLAEKYQEAEKMTDEHFFGIPINQQAFQPIGDLLLNFKGSENVTDYYRELNMESGIAKITYKVNDAKYTREVFMSYPDHVMVVRLTCDKPNNISVEAKLKSPYLDEIVIEPGKLTMNGTWSGPCPIANNLIAPVDGKGLKFQTSLIAYPEEGQYIEGDSSLIVNNANSLTFVLTIATSYKNYKDIGGDPAAACDKVLQSIAGKDYETLRQRHEDDFSNLMSRVHLNIGDPLMNEKPIDERLTLAKAKADADLAAKVFQFGRYALVASNRKGGQPANLQAIWNESVAPSWGSKYTMNINFQMNYWPAEVCNLSECHEPFFQTLKELAETGAKTAMTHYGVSGWVVHHNFDLWRGTAPVDAARYGMWPVGGAWLCRHIWEHYLYTGDKEFLREYYPIMKGSAEFLMNIMIEHPKYKWLVTPFSMSPEHGYFDNKGNKAFLSPSPTMDVAIIRDLFPACIEASKILNVDADFRTTIEKALTKIPPYQIGQDKRIQEWIEDYKRGPEGHNLSTHYPFFPGNSITLHGDQKLVAAVQKFLEPRWGRGGFTTMWDMAMWARLRNGERPDTIIKTYVGSGRLGNDLHNSGSNQSDATFGYTAAVAECLLQSHDGEISLLPALPVSWTKGSVTGLRARGGFVVDMTWEEGKLKHCEIKSLIGNPCVVRYGEKTTTYNIPSGKSVKIKV